MLPLEARYPAIARLPRAALGRFPSPVERVVLADGTALWLKRDDLDADVMGGNKVRALEFLLGAVRAGDTVLTLGGAGSTHVLATAYHARRLGAHTVAVRWRHEMHDVAHRVHAEASRLCVETTAASNAVVGIARALALRVRRRVHWVPMGGSTPLGALGHVNAALELAQQVSEGTLPEPARIVVPLGTGGTAAGLAVGLGIAGLRSTLVCARVGPRPFVRRGAVLALARRTRRLLARLTGDAIPKVPDAQVTVSHQVYGGAYGRPLAAGTLAAATLHAAAGLTLDATYAAKAGALAIELARAGAGEVLLWVTFDGRWL